MDIGFDIGTISWALLQSFLAHQIILTVAQVLFAEDTCLRTEATGHDEAVR